MRYKLLLFGFLRCLVCFSQNDSIVYNDDAEDGIYLTYGDFRRNNFIGKDKIVSDLNKEQLEFVGKVMDGNKFSYKVNDGVATVDAKTAWGFFQNKTLYVNFRGDFYRVPLFGSICYLVATVTVVNSGFYDPMFGYGVNGARTKEIREFMINFYDGIVTEFSVEKVESLLKRDPDLYTEFKALSRKKQKEQVNRYIRKYNELHPVYFLK